jgi:YD repeat-containing protein
VVGSYKAIVVGLGGWTLSAHHFYDVTKGMLYFGDGTSRQVTAQLVNNNTRYRAASDDGAEVYLFDRRGLHLSTLHGLTGAVLYRFAYDAQRRLLSMTDAYGNQTRILRDGSGTLTGIQAPFGQVTQLTLGADGYLAAIANPRGDTHTMTYYAGGLLRTVTKPRGQVSTFTYDQHGLLLRDANSAGNAVRFVTESQDPTTGTRSVQMATALGRTTHLALEQTATGMRRTETDPQGVERTFSTDYNRQMTTRWADTTIQDIYHPDVRLGDLAHVPASRTLNTTASAFAQTATQTVTPAELTSPFTYTSLETQITTNGKRTELLYTRATGQTVVTTPVGRTLSMTHDAWGKLKQTRLAAYTPVRYAYDTHGRLTTVTQGPRTTTRTYNAQGEVDAITNALGHTTRFTYDSAGRVLTQTLPNARVIRYGWDANGNLTRVSPPGKPAHRFTWRLFDLVGSYLPPAISGALTGTTVYTYNRDEQLTRIQRPDGQTITFTYDATGGHLTALTIPDGQYTYTYANGLVRTAQSPDGLTNTLTYAGTQVLSDAVTNPSGASVGAMQFTYNNDLLVSSSTAVGAAPSDTRTVPFVYDADNLPLRAGNQRYTRDPQAGVLTGTTLARLAETYGYSATYGEPTTVVAQHTAPTGVVTPLFRQVLRRDAVGRITRNTETRLGTTTTYAYTYDPAGRLTDVHKNGASASHYTYDTNSNRIAGTAGGAALRATYDAQDRLMT